jgi:hypothetical protein
MATAKTPDFNIKYVYHKKFHDESIEPIKAMIALSFILLRIKPLRQYERSKQCKMMCVCVCVCVCVYYPLQNDVYNQI